MELCTGGSLFNILDDPENTYGLGETDFKFVLEHLGRFHTENICKKVPITFFLKLAGMKPE